VKDIKPFCFQKKTPRTGRKMDEESTRAREHAEVQSSCKLYISMYPHHPKAKRDLRQTDLKAFLEASLHVLWTGDIGNSCFTKS
jgi:hypothetical protein